MVGFNNPDILFEKDGSLKETLGYYGGIEFVWVTLHYIVLPICTFENNIFPRMYSFAAFCNIMLGIFLDDMMRLS